MIEAWILSFLLWRNPIPEIAYAGDIYLRDPVTHQVLARCYDSSFCSYGGIFSFGFVGRIEREWGHKQISCWEEIQKVGNTILFDQICMEGLK